MQNLRKSILKAATSHLKQTYSNAGLIFGKKLAVAVITLAAFMLIGSQSAQAHTTRICWQDVGNVTTFYAGTYHTPTEGPSPIGGIIIDGFTYPFSGWIYPSALPSGAQCVQPDPYSPSVVHYQTFTSSFPGGAHTVSFTNSHQVQAPWTNFPQLTFGGGACADADFDGICNNQDSCPLDFNNDADGDGICANVDNCPLNNNPAQTDANGNGQGDACEGVVCGNLLVQGNEQCDDGNIAGGDGCSAICTLELPDTTAPVLSSIPANITTEATSSSGATVTFSLPTATDDTDGSLAVTCAPASGSTFTVGSHTVTCSATDAAGNTGTGSFTVNVVDTTTPVISGMPSSMTIEATSSSGAVASWTNPTATDTVSGSVNVTCSPASGSTFALGTHTVICSAQDGANNTASANFTVTVQDTTAPSLSLPVNQTLYTVTTNAPFSWTATANDIVSGNVSVTCAPASPATFNLGTTTVNCSATDSAGNTGSGGFTVTVLDNGLPSVSIVTPVNNANYTLNQNVPADYSCADAGSGIQSCVGNAAAGAPIDTATVGTKTFTVIATDNAGNQSSQTVSYTVSYSLATLFDQTKAHNSGSNIPIKLKIVDAGGVNQSNSSVVITALRVEPGNLPAVSPGGSNPTNVFTFDPVTQSYHYNLKTEKTWAAGTYQLIFSIAGDPVEHSVNFVIR